MHRNAPLALLGIYAKPARHRPRRLLRLSASFLRSGLHSGGPAGRVLAAMGRTRTCFFMAQPAGRRLAGSSTTHQAEHRSGFSWRHGPGAVGLGDDWNLAKAFRTKIHSGDDWRDARLGIR